MDMHVDRLNAKSSAESSGTQRKELVLVLSGWTDHIQQRRADGESNAQGTGPKALLSVIAL